jgi:hypothetical protein
MEDNDITVNGIEGLVIPFKDAVIVAVPEDSPATTPG